MGGHARRNIQSYLRDVTLVTGGTSGDNGPGNGFNDTRKENQINAAKLWNPQNADEKWEVLAAADSDFPASIILWLSSCRMPEFSLPEEVSGGRMTRIPTSRKIATRTPRFTLLHICSEGLDRSSHLLVERSQGKPLSNKSLSLFMTNPQNCYSASGGHRPGDLGPFIVRDALVQFQSTLQSAHVFLRKRRTQCQCSQGWK